ncbi:hypothetical protein V1517DRAFT_351442 [Lipomyces orientalis]|uniref:Uncharacterized protein n=1 Tax=Lipomyces orientalis TaxID=1233043 RepID=A0ACC3TTB1_9ASCO
MYSQPRDAQSAPSDYSASLHLAAPLHHHPHQQPVHADDDSKPGSFGIRRPYLNNLPSLHLLNPPMSPPGPSSSASSATSAGSTSNNLLTPPTFESAAAPTSSTAPESYGMIQSSSYPNNSSMSYWAAASDTDVVLIYIVAILATVVIVHRVVALCILVVCRCGLWQQFCRSVLPSNNTSTTRSLDVLILGIDNLHPFTIRLLVILPAAFTAAATITAILLRRLPAMAILSADESAAAGARAATVSYLSSLV